MGSVEMGLTAGAAKLNVATGGRANHSSGNQRGIIRDFQARSSQQLHNEVSSTLLCTGYYLSRLLFTFLHFLFFSLCSRLSSDPRAPPVPPPP